MDLRTHFAAIWRHKWVILVATWLVGAAVFGLVARQGKVYRATAQLDVAAGQGASGQQSVQDAVPFLAKSYATLAKTRPVVADAASRSKLRITEHTARGRLSASTPNDIGFIQLDATGPSPQAALQLDRAFGDALVAAVNAQQQQALQAQIAPIERELGVVAAQLSALPPDSPQRPTLETQYQAINQSLVTAELQPVSHVEVVSPAQAGSAPIAPRPKRDALLALVTALVIFAELSVANEVVTDRLPKSTRDEDIRRLTGLPVLARIPGTAGWEQVEAFRTLRTNLMFRNGSPSTRTVAVVSFAPQVGKTFVAINLVESLADLGVGAVLIDADLRRPAIAGRLGLTPSPGLSEALQGRAEVAAALRSHRTDHDYEMLVMPAGTLLPDPAGLLTRGFDSKVLTELTSAEAVVVDTPPESLFPDAAITALCCDCTLIVIDATGTRKRSLLGLLQRLRDLGANPLGIVVNRSTREH